MPTIAVVGASNDRSKYGNKAVRAYLKRGWTVYPVNPAEAEVEGLRAYPTARDVPARVDRLALYVPPRVGERLLDDFAAANPREIFLNPGTESTALMAGLAVRNLPVATGCAIIDIGEQPADY